MWKKLGVTLIALLSTFSVVYAMNKDISASMSINVRSGAMLTGRIGPLKEADNILFETNGMAFQLVKNDLEDSSGKKYPLTVWLSFSKEAFAHTAYNAASVLGDATSLSNISYTNSEPNKKLKPLSALVSNSTMDNKIIRPRLSIISSYIDPTEKTLFGLHGMEATDALLDLTTNQLAFHEKWWFNCEYKNNGDVYIYIDADGTYNTQGGVIKYARGYEVFASRAAVYLDLSNVVFGLSQSNDNLHSGVSTVTPPLYETTKPINEAIGDDMKLRINDVSYSMTSALTQITDLNDAPISITTEYNSIRLYAKANVGSKHTLSALFFDEYNNFVAYKPIGNAKGDSQAYSYDLDLTGLPTGKYQIAVVNEVYDSSTTAPAFSSLISNKIALEVVPLQKLTYTPDHGGGLNTYEYDKNVEVGDKVGSFTRSDGVVPINYKLVADGSDTTYQNFEITGLDPSGNSSAISLDVNVKASGAPDIVSSTNSLKAGTYKFCVESVDANGFPTVPQIGTTKFCTSFTVDKAAPTISFNTTTQKDMKIGDSVFTDSITTSNKDTLTTSDVTYSLSGGTSNVLTSSTNSSDPFKYDLSVVSTYTGSSLPAPFTLQATVKETANYLQATTTVNRPIYVYKELSSLKWTANKGSYSSNDVTTGKTIGDLLAKDGVGPFDYELTTSVDPGNATDGINNGLFTIVNGMNVASGTKVNVNTSSNLSVGSYKLQFKVADKGKGTTVYATAIINVSAQVQNKVYFTDSTGTNDITAQGITLKFNEKNVSLLAKGGSNSLPMEYHVAAQADQPNQIDPSLYLGVNQTSGLLTPIKVGTIKVYTTRPGDSNYGSADSAFMDVTIQPAEQSIAFNIATNPNSVGKGNTIVEKATGTVTLTNTQGEGGITYSSTMPSVAKIDANGNVTGVNAGTTTITAILNDPTSPTYKPNYETQSCQKTITVYNAMTLNWNPKAPNLKAESSTAGSSAGSVSAVSNTGSVRYNVSTNTGIVENADGGLFTITPSGNVQLKNTITAAALAGHGSNTYKVRVEATDNNGTTFIDIIITIDDATNTPHFTDSNGNVISSIAEVYGENSNTFQLYSTTSNGISAAYQLDPSDTRGTISVNGLGQVTINKVGTGSAQLIASAGTGYDGATLNIPITITPGNQAIAFVDTSTLNRQFVINSTFNEPAELKETSANSASGRTITYTSTTPSVCRIDVAGTISMLTTGNCTVTAENKESNWQPVTTTKTINLFMGMGVTFAQSNTPQAETASAQVGSPVGSLTVNGGSGNKNYAIATANTPQNKDASFFTINNNSGVISLNKTVNASDIASSYDSVKQAYILYVQFETSDALGNKVTTNAEVQIKGAPLNAKFDRVVNGKITQTYSLNGTFTVQLSSNAGNGQETYQLKNDPTMPTDVLQSVQANGLVTIDNANDRTANPKPVMVEAIIPASNGYDSETIEVEVEIIKANQPGFGFTNTIMQMPVNSTLTPVITGQLSNGTITLTSMDPTALLVKGNDIESNAIEDTVTIFASDSGDRNYNIASGQATVTISSAPAYPFTISVPPATYGDTGLKATIVTNGGGANKQQTWVSSDPTIADVDASGNLTIYQAGKVNITCTQATTGEPNVSSTAVFTIKPKPITITINDKSKYIGEAVPGFDMTIPNGVLVPGDTISLPNFSCLDTASIPVTSKTPAGNYPITGTYPTGANSNYAITVTPGTLTVKQDASQASWYHLEGVTSGNTLDPTKWYNEDVKVVLDTATETAGTYDEISLNQTLWASNSITVTQEDENSEDVYFRVSASGILSTSQSTTIKIDKTKPIVKSITGTQTNKDALSTLINNLTFGTFFKPGTLVSIKSEDVLPSPNVKVSGLQEVSYNVYEIDRKTGIINSVSLDTGTDIPDANGSIEVKLDDVGLYRVCAIANDNAGNASGESCSDVNIKNLDVDIDDDGENEFQDPGKDGCPDINIPLQDEKGGIYKINVDRDGDGIPDLNIDSDGDGIAEINVDTDKDGKPDLNLVILSKWEPTFCAKEQIDYEGKPIVYCTMQGIKPVINVDLGNDGKPDVDIDTNGDMKPDYNITKDGKTPIINIGPVHPWDPKTDYDSDGFAYDSIKKDEVTPQLNIDTDGDGRPDVNLDPTNSGEPTLNIDVNGDGIPDVDIDSDGDGIKDINIDEDGNGTADKNIVKITEWVPDHNSDSIKDFPFDTMNSLKLKDTIIDEESGIQIQKPGGSFLPNHAIKVEDIKDTIGEDDKNKLDEFVEGDLEIKDIFDVKLSDGTNNIQPDGSIKVRIPVSEEIANSDTVKVIIEQTDGSYKEVTATIKDGYIEYETDYLGKVGIIADKAKAEEPDPDKPDVPIPDFKPNGSGGSTPDTSVKGNYTPGIGGAGTGDTVMLLPYGISMGVAIGILLLIRLTRKKHRDV